MPIVVLAQHSKKAVRNQEPVSYVTFKDETEDITDTGFQSPRAF